MKVQLSILSSTHIYFIVIKIRLYRQTAVIRFHSIKLVVLMQDLVKISNYITSCQENKEESSFNLILAINYNGAGVFKTVVIKLKLVKKVYVPEFHLIVHKNEIKRTPSKMKIKSFFSISGLLNIRCHLCPS
jgi:hypothetical protein